MSDFKARMHQKQIWFPLDYPDPAGEDYSDSPDLAV